MPWHDPKVFELLQVSGMPGSPQKRGQRHPLELPAVEEPRFVTSMVCVNGEDSFRAVRAASVGYVCEVLCKKSSDDNSTLEYRDCLFANARHGIWDLSSPSPHFSAGIGD